MIATCSPCKPHAYQDKKYGTNRRVMNSCKEGKSLRCTVCGTEKNAGGDTAPKARKGG